MTPLHRAAQSGHAEVIGLLLAAGASVDADDVMGASPLHYAARAGQAEAARLLLNGGANVAKATDGGITPLHEAAGSAAPGGESVARLLLAQGAPLQVRDFERSATPLQYAVQAGRADIARLLRSAMAAVAATDAAAPTLVLPPARQGDIVWLAGEVTPLAVRGDTWVLGVVTVHSGIDGAESACEYRSPWPSRTTTAHGLWLQRWRLTGVASTLMDSAEVAAQVQGSPGRCTPPAEIARRFAADATRGLEGRVEAPAAVWRLEDRDFFAHHGRGYRVTLRVDSTATSRRTRACFTSVGWPQPRCTTIAITPGPNYRDRVRPTVVVVHEGALWIFGLRTFSEAGGGRAWPSVIPVFIGRVPVDSL